METVEENRPEERRLPVEIMDTDLLHTVNTLLNDKTGEDKKPWSEEVQKTKILSVLDDHEEMTKGRQKELHSLKEMDHDSCEMFSGCGQTSDSNTMGRSRDRRVRDVQAGSEGLQSMSGAYSARDVLNNTVDTVSENNVVCKFT